MRGVAVSVFLIATLSSQVAAAPARPKAPTARPKAPAASAGPAARPSAPPRPVPPPPAPVPTNPGTFPCRASDPTIDGRGKLGAGLLDVRSNVGDRFSIRGKDGVFLCRPGVRGLTLPISAQGGKPFNLAVANYSEAKGETSPRLFAMPETEQRLQRVADRLADAWPHPDAARVKVKLAADSQFNAHAHPDGVIIVNVGLFAPAPGATESDLSDNDLYWILGHEYAHVALRHAARSQALQDRTAGARKLAGIYMEGAKINAAFNYAAGHGAGALEGQMRTAKMAHSQFQFTLRNIVDPAWGRTNEDQADVAGFDLAAALGYFPRFDLATARFQASETSMEQRLAVVQLRVNGQVQGVMKQERFTQAIHQGQLSGLFSDLITNIQEGLLRGVKEFLTGWFSRDHRSSKARADGLTDYRTDSFARAKLLPALQLYGGEAQAVEASSEMAAALIATAAIEAAEADMMQGDAKAAQASIAPAMATRFRDESLTLFTAARAAEGGGDRAGAIRLLERSRNSPTVSPDAYAMLASLHTKSGQLAAARPVIVEGRRKTKDDDFFLPEDVRIAARERKLDVVEKLLIQCRDTGRELISVNCVEAALDVEWDKLSESQQDKLRELADFGGTADPNDNRAQKAIKSLKSIRVPGLN